MLTSGSTISERWQRLVVLVQLGTGLGAQRARADALAEVLEDVRRDLAAHSEMADHPALQRLSPATVAALGQLPGTPRCADLAGAPHRADMPDLVLAAASQTPLSVAAGTAPRARLVVARALIRLGQVAFIRRPSA